MVGDGESRAGFVEVGDISDRAEMIDQRPKHFAVAGRDGDLFVREKLIGHRAPHVTVTHVVIDRSVELERRSDADVTSVIFAFPFCIHFVRSSRSYFHQ